MTHDTDPAAEAHVPEAEVRAFYRPRPPSDDDIAQVKILVKELHEMLAEARGDAADRNRRIREAAEARRRGRR